MDFRIVMNQDGIMFEIKDNGGGLPADALWAFADALAADLGGTFEVDYIECFERVRTLVPRPA